MARSKSFDNKSIKCDQAHSINYFSHLYGKDEKVERFLRRHFALKTIHDKTHIELFRMIEKELGVPIP